MLTLKSCLNCYYIKYAHYAQNNNNNKTTKTQATTTLLSKVKPLPKPICSMGFGGANCTLGAMFASRQIYCVSQEQLLGLLFGTTAFLPSDLCYSSFFPHGKQLLGSWTNLSCSSLLVVHQTQMQGPVNRWFYFQVACNLKLLPRDQLFIKLFYVLAVEYVSREDGTGTRQRKDGHISLCAGTLEEGWPPLQ